MHKDTIQLPIINRPDFNSLAPPAHDMRVPDQSWKEGKEGGKRKGKIIGMHMTHFDPASLIVNPALDIDPLTLTSILLDLSIP